MLWPIPRGRSEPGTTTAKACRARERPHAFAVSVRGIRSPRGSRESMAPALAPRRERGASTSRRLTDPSRLVDAVEDTVRLSAEGAIAVVQDAVVGPRVR